jgi:hypothetical protein
MGSVKRAVVGGVGTFIALLGVARINLVGAEARAASTQIVQNVTVTGPISPSILGITVRSRCTFADGTRIDSPSTFGLGGGTLTAAFSNVAESCSFAAEFAEVPESSPEFRSGAATVTIKLNGTEIASGKPVNALFASPEVKMLTPSRLDVLVAFPDGITYPPVVRPPLQPVVVSVTPTGTSPEGLSGFLVNADCTPRFPVTTKPAADVLQGLQFGPSGGSETRMVRITPETKCTFVVQAQFETVVPSTNVQFQFAEDAPIRGFSPGPNGLNKPYVLGFFNEKMVQVGGTLPIRAIFGDGIPTTTTIAASTTTVVASRRTITAPIEIIGPASPSVIGMTLQANCSSESVPTSQSYVSSYPATGGSLSARVNDASTCSFQLLFSESADNPPPFRSAASITTMQFNGRTIARGAPANAAIQTESVLVTQDSTLQIVITYPPDIVYPPVLRPDLKPLTLRVQTAGVPAAGLATISAQATCSPFYRDNVSFYDVFGPSGGTRTNPTRYDDSSKCLVQTVVSFLGTPSALGVRVQFGNEEPISGRVSTIQGYTVFSIDFADRTIQPGGLLPITVLFGNEPSETTSTALPTTPPTTNPPTTNPPPPTTPPPTTILSTNTGSQLSIEVPAAVAVGEQFTVRVSSLQPYTYVEIRAGQIVLGWAKADATGTAFLSNAVWENTSTSITATEVVHGKPGRTRSVPITVGYGSVSTLPGSKRSRARSADQGVGIGFVA